MIFADGLSEEACDRIANSKAPRASWSRAAFGQVAVVRPCGCPVWIRVTDLVDEAVGLRARCRRLCTALGQVRTASDQVLTPFPPAIHPPYCML